MGEMEGYSHAGQKGGAGGPGTGWQEGQYAQEGAAQVEGQVGVKSRE